MSLPRLSFPSKPLTDVQRRWRLSWLFAVAMTLLYPLDRWMLGRPSPETLVLRIAWGLEVLAVMWLRGRLQARWSAWADSLQTVLASAFFVGLIFLTGGTQSPYVGSTASVPLVIALVFTETAMPAVLSGAVCLVGLVLMGGLEGHPEGLLGWYVLVVSSTFFGTLGAIRFRKAQASEAQVLIERARREALEKLTVAERHRTQAEKLATVGRLAANVMHEINNPLAFVRSNLDYLRAELLAHLPESVREEAREVFDETHVGVERIQRIVTDLKGFSRMDGEEPAECVLADVVTDAAMLAAVRLRNVARLRVEMPPGLPEVIAAPRRLAQVVLNLLVNAGDALEQARVPEGEVRISGGVENGRVVLLVEDNGPGFAPEVLPRLFEAFFTTKGPEKGTGLGLNLSREMVERFGGTIRAENRPEGGARVRLELAVRPSAEAREGVS
ncbi:sensor histidine kinase [Melittangium boletus]|uniref:sensor histidine kinase n=1 Tax=Melittangium boletus TaxID=83453 RepID=UPI003DA5D0A1